MHFQFPNSKAIIPGYNFEQLPDSPAFTEVVVIWGADLFPDMPPKVVNFLKNRYDINSKDYPINYFEQPYKYNSSDTVKLGVLRFSLPKRAP